MGLNKSKIIRKFKDEVDKGRVKMEEEVASILNDYTLRIKSRIDDNFRAFDHHLKTEEENLMKMKSINTEINSTLKEVNVDINKNLN